MTKKLLAVLVAVMVMLTAVVGTFSLAEPVSPSDVVEDPVVLTLDANTGTGAAMAPVVPDADGNVTLPAVTYVKNNFVFEGWNTAPDGSGTLYQPGAVLTIEVATTLYAQWIKEGVELVFCTVTYDANGGEGETVDDFSPYIQNGLADTVMNEFTREGYLFKEWNTKADGTGISYEEFAGFEIQEDTVLYAIWEKDPDYVEPEVPTDEIVDIDVPNEDEAEDEADSDNPETGESAAAAVALALSAVAMGAVVLLKKKAD